MKDFIKYLEENPFIGRQEQCGRGNNYWNADYWTIEVAKCFYYGENYVLSQKFKGNKFANFDRIKKDANIKLYLRNILEKIKNETDCLLIAEVGRGLDIIIANMVKKWKKIYCYDQVNYRAYLKFDNVEFIHKPTGIFNPDLIKENNIFIMNHSIYPYDKFMNSIHGIINGELIW